MIAAIAQTPRPVLSGIVATLLERQRELTLFGGTVLILALGTTMLQLVDPRQLNGVNVWVKPTKFLVSTAAFALTSAWFFGYVRPERRRARGMRVVAAVLIVSASLELAWIGWQASQGLASHFNKDSLFYGVMYQLMGLFALVLTATAPALGWEIARRPAPGLPRDFVAAVVLGLVLTFVLGASLGFYMSGQPGHAVGAEGGRVPIVGWNRSGGDLRVAHFLSIHAQQAIPLLAAAAGALGLPEHTRWRVLIGGTGLFVAVTLAVFAQAVAGRPLLPLA
jgi:hypothetical protein